MCPSATGAHGSPHSRARGQSPAHRSRSMRPSVDGAVAYRPAGTGLRVVVGRRPRRARVRKPSPRTPLPPGEAVFTTDLTLSLEAILAQDRERWAVEIPSRDRNACAGLGQDQGRKHERGVGAHTWRLGLVAARTLWWVRSAAQTPARELRRYRPWSRQKVAPSQLDIAWTWREARHAAGVFPTPRFAHDPAEIQPESEKTLPLAA